MLRIKSTGYHFIVLLLVINFGKAQEQRQLAITINDPDIQPGSILSWERRNKNIIKALRKHKIKSALFVCGMRVNSKDGLKLLQMWDNKEHLICNHTYSHLFYDSKKYKIDVFIHDFLKGDSLINGYKNYTRLVRFPCLTEDYTGSKRDDMREALKIAGYDNGSVTIDASDLYIDKKLNEELKKDAKADLTAYKKYYISHILNRANYYDSLATKLFHRKIKHTLLIHHNLLNALFLDELLIAIKKDGWQLIDAKDAYTDSVFKLQPLLVPCGESIIWERAKLNPAFSKYLRYPPEDSEYEELPLQKAIEEYKESWKLKK